MRFHAWRLVHAAEIIGAMTNASSGMRLGSRNTAIVRAYFTRLPLGGRRRAAGGSGRAVTTDASSPAVRKASALIAAPRVPTPRWPEPAGSCSRLPLDGCHEPRTDQPAL